MRASAVSYIYYISTIHTAAHVYTTSRRIIALFDPGNVRPRAICDAHALSARGCGTAVQDSLDRVAKAHPYLDESVIVDKYTEILSGIKALGGAA